MTVRQPINFLQGAGVVRMAGAILSNAEILALPTTGIEIIPDPGPGRIFFGLGAFLHLNWFADYGNINVACLLSLGSRTGSVLSIAALTESLGQVSGLLTEGESASAFLGQRALGAAEVFGNSGSLDSDIENVGFYLKANNEGDSDFSGGDPRNTLTVTVLYVPMELNDG
jgi:hypothetical protein